MKPLARGNQESPSTVLHWDGDSWKTVVSNTMRELRGVFGLSANDIWAVGDSGTVLHYTGGQWTTAISNTSVSLHGVWAAGAADVYAVGVGSTIQHCEVAGPDSHRGSEAADGARTPLGGPRSL